MKFADSTAERCQVVGTGGVISLLGNINKHRTFLATLGEVTELYPTRDVFVRVETSAGLWEVAKGSFDPVTNTITRTEFISSITGAAINFPAGTHTCYSVLPAKKVATKYVSPLFGNGSDLGFQFDHNLGNTAVCYRVYEPENLQRSWIEGTAIGLEDLTFQGYNLTNLDNNSIEVTFLVPPAVDQFRIVVFG